MRAMNELPAPVPATPQEPSISLDLERRLREFAPSFGVEPDVFVKDVIARSKQYAAAYHGPSGLFAALKAGSDSAANAIANHAYLAVCADKGRSPYGSNRATRRRAAALVRQVAGKRRRRDHERAQVAAVKERLWRGVPFSGATSTT